MTIFKYLSNRENMSVTLSVAALFIGATLWFRLGAVEGRLGAVEADMRELRVEMKTDIAEVKTDMRELRVEMKTDMREIRTLIIGLYNQKPLSTKQVNGKVEGSIGSIDTIVVSDAN